MLSVLSWLHGTLMTVDRYAQDWCAPALQALLTAGTPVGDCTIPVLHDGRHTCAELECACLSESLLTAGTCVAESERPYRT